MNMSFINVEWSDFKPGKIRYQRKQFGIRHKFKDTSGNPLVKPITKTKDPKKKIPRHNYLYENKK